ncbi:MAG: FKBP-type peptidyl-prolyl cis-trans isomerase [Prevotella sp.]|nr:FKBP-type peptidyl-prolyl cis-trans isomerase [Prevotella sp.]
MNRRQTICQIALLLLTLGTVTACSESDDETTEEFSNWEARNNAFFLSLEDSLKNNGSQWKKLKTFTKDEKKVGAVTDYIYVKMLKRSDELETPIYTDTVRVAYRGRLIPSATYPQGYVFDQTYVGNYNYRTTDVSNSLVSGFVDGFATALQHMHKGDLFRVYIPYTLGYGASGSGSIPGYSTLIFDVELIDFSSGTSKMEPWTSRRQ